MKVRRIVSNALAAKPEAAVAFYRDLLGLDVLMDMGWIVTLGNEEKPRVQVSIASEGGSGTPLPALSMRSMISRRHCGACRRRRAIRMGRSTTLGVRRCSPRPVGTLVNVLTHL